MSPFSKTLQDISSVADIEMLVHTFYGKVQKDPLIGGVFNGILNGRWEEHLEKMVRFWQTILFNERTYSGAPFPPHAMLPIRQQHFDRWRELFLETVDSHFEGVHAEEAKARATLMASLFLSKIEHIQGKNLPQNNMDNE